MTRLRPATTADFAFIRSLTTNPAYAPFIGDDDEATLAGYLSNPACRLMIWGDQHGFAIFNEVGNPSGRVELFRLALAHTNGGQGLAFVQALTDYAFETLGAKRVWLDASAENLRAMKVYERAGYAREGVLRQHWWRPALGRAVDLVMFGVLRDEWTAGRR
jgi:RimJ/RimL family protein N-acetyltransferase